MKNKRQAMILELVDQYPIYSQQELADRLVEHGVPAAQPTISRDIKELRHFKVQDETGNYKYTYEKGDAALRFSSLLHDSIVRFDYSENIVIIKCHVGMAQAVCAALDVMQLVDVMGTIAGDDTIFVVTHGGERSRALIETLKKKALL